MLRELVIGAAGIAVGYVAGIATGYKAAVVDYVENEARVIRKVADRIYDETVEEVTEETFGDLGEAIQEQLLEEGRVPQSWGDDEDSDEGSARGFQ